VWQGGIECRLFVRRLVTVEQRIEDGIQRMTKLNELLAMRRPIIAASFTDRDLGITPQELARHGLDLAEFRIDLFRSREETHVKSIISRYAGLATVATIRSENEGGGSWGGSDDDRLRLFRLLATEVDALDIELNSRPIVDDVVRAAHENGKLAILSYHDFQRTPDLSELNTLLVSANAAGADIFKIASYVQSDKDLQILAEFTIQNGSRNQLVTIGLGPQGMMSRIFFPALGSRITFSSAGETTGAGQMETFHTFELMRTFYPGYNESKVIELGLMEFA
jgi:3-dehydroquinate dehydratase I